MEELNKHQKDYWDIRLEEILQQVSNMISSILILTAINRLIAKVQFMISDKSLFIGV